VEIKLQLLETKLPTTCKANDTISKNQLTEIETTSRYIGITQGVMGEKVMLSMSKWGCRNLATLSLMLCSILTNQG